MTSVRRNILANYLGQGWAGFMALAFLPLYIEKLGMEAYGLIGLFAVMQSLLMLLDVGMTPTLNREMARFAAGAHTSQSIRDLLYSLEVICYGLAVLVAAGIWFASDYLARDWIRAEQLSENAIRQALGVMAIVIALRFCEGIYRGALYGLERLAWYNGAYSLLTTLRYGGAIAVLEWVSASIEAFFLWQAAVSILTLAVLMAGVHTALPKAPLRPKFSRSALARVWKFAGGMSAATFLGMLLLQTDKVLLSRLLTLKEFGNYALAAAAASVLYSIVVPVTQATYPRMVRHSTVRDDAALIATYRQTTVLAMALTTSAAMLLAFYSGGIMFMWSGNGDLAADTAPLASVLALGSLLNCLAYLPYNLQLVHGRTGFLVKINIVAVAALAIAVSWAAPRFGPLGAAWAWVAVNAGYAFISSYITHSRYIPRGRRDWWIFDVLLPGGIVVGIMLLLRHMQPVEYQDRSQWLLFLLLTGGASVLAALAVSTMARRQFCEGDIHGAPHEP